MEELEELRRKAAIARRKLDDAEEEERNKTIRPALRKTIGKCFKYINSYGGNLPRWPLYVKVIDMDEKSLTFSTIEFQRTSLDTVEVKLSQKYNFYGKNYMEGSGYIPIPNSEYNRAKKALLKFMEEKLSY